ncbi:hypothetical protein [Aureimonas sp. AU4]|uniref:hypothetical protein n=1 Tax=Aureimonas sp. AU4 TaxID=1638163 RepID=UPI000782EC09|nr:hypothetical protein [Aureimonas sp. AU4]
MMPFANLVGRSRPDNTADPNHALFATAGTTTWTVPAGVFWIAALCVGTGGNGFGRTFAGGSNVGGGGGNLVWANMIPVTPGEVLTITVPVPSTGNGVPGRPVTIARADGSLLVSAAGGHGGSDNGYRFDGVGQSVFTNDAKGKVNAGGMGQYGLSTPSGGGGAAGYSGTGGTGGTTSDQGSPASDGNGGGGGGGGVNYVGAGVGLLGEGASGKAGAQSSPATGGSGGDTAISATLNTSGGTNTVRYGSGGVGAASSTNSYAKGSQGAARVLYGKGPNNGGRAFPASNVSSATA